MIQLKIISGNKVGTEMVARHFPFQVGRSAKCELRLDDAGVWENHFQIALSSSDGFSLTADENTSVVIDGKTMQQTILRNGDVIELGLAKILFGFIPTRQKSLVFREWLTWIALAALCLGQLMVIRELLR